VVVVVVIAVELMVLVVYDVEGGTSTESVGEHGAQDI
jgi:hypothetical protein